MPLEDLVSLIERLAQRMAQHGPLLRQSEALTRYALIDPLLRGLGWDTEDPTKVRPEYPGSGGYADYALMGGDRPIALVEAKKLGEPLAASVQQALNYCNSQGINFMIVTDGDRWEMYEVFKQAKIEDRKVFSISLSAEPHHSAAIKTLSIWHPSLLTGKAEVAPVPAFKTESVAPRPIETSPTPPVPTPAVSPVAPAAPQGTGAWKELRDVVAQKGAKAPSAIRFPDGKEMPIKYWVEILQNVAEWLVAKGVLTAAKCPANGMSKERYVVHSLPQHPSGKSFFNPHQLGNGLYVELNISADQSIRLSQSLLSQLGQSSAGFQLQIG